MCICRDTVLRTPRLRLRAPTDADICFVQDMYSRAEVTRWIGDGRPEPTRDQAAARITRYRSRFGPRAGVWLVERRDDDHPVGFVLLKPIPFSTGAEAEEEDTEIGWHLHPNAWGSGFASEAAEALLDGARTQGLPRVVAVTHPDNVASRSVAERIGMTHEGLTTRYYDSTCELYTLDL